MTATGILRNLEVLLISPVRGLDPNSGDVTYTEQLVASPPPGVTYTTYDRALADGRLVEVGSRTSVVAGSLGERAQAAPLAIWRKAEGLARHSGRVYRERLRHFRIQPGAFDLVHVHVFHTRLLGRRPPVVFSSASPLRWVYQDAWGWSAWRVARADTFDRAVGRAWGATMCGGRPGQAAALVTFSKDYRRWLVSHRGVDPAQVHVVPNYLALDVRPRPVAPRPSKLGFVAKDFAAKGGHTLLAAFERLRAERPDLTLTIVGSEPPSLVPAGVRWLPFVPREELLARVLPGMDVFVYPSEFDGFPYGPMEALAHGIPVVVSNYRGLPELVAGGAGRVARVGNDASVAAGVRELLEPNAWLQASQSARRTFEDRFSAESQAAALGRVYRSVDGRERPPPRC